MTTLLTPEQAADRLGIKKTKFYELLGEGAFPVIKIGRASRIPDDAVEAWIRRQVADASEGGAR